MCFFATTTPAPSHPTAAARSLSDAVPWRRLRLKTSAICSTFVVGIGGFASQALYPGAASTSCGRSGSTTAGSSRSAREWSSCVFYNLALGVCLGSTTVGAKCGQDMWLRHVIVKVVSSRGRKVDKKEVSKNAPKHVVTRHGRKLRTYMQDTCRHRSTVGHCFSKHDTRSIFKGVFALQKRKPLDHLFFTTTIFVARDNKTQFTTTCGKLFATSFPVLC